MIVWLIFIFIGQRNGFETVPISAIRGLRLLDPRGSLGRVSGNSCLDPRAQQTLQETFPEWVVSSFDPGTRDANISFYFYSREERKSFKASKNYISGLYRFNICYSILLTYSLLEIFKFVEKQDSNGWLRVKTQVFRLQKFLWGSLISFSRVEKKVWPSSHPDLSWFGRRSFLRRRIDRGGNTRFTKRKSFLFFCVLSEGREVGKIRGKDIPFSFANGCIKGEIARNCIIPFFYKRKEFALLNILLEKGFGKKEVLSFIIIPSNTQSLPFDCIIGETRQRSPPEEQLFEIPMDAHLPSVGEGLHAGAIRGWPGTGSRWCTARYRWVPWPGISTDFSILRVPLQSSRLYKTEKSLFFFDSFLFPSPSRDRET